jgi:type II secretory pathway predicted ATPase ExeA
MKFNPFSKHADSNYFFESDDFNQATARLKHLCEIKGIGLFAGSSGCGKTFTIKKYIDSLNPSLYKIFYLPLSTLTVMEFYRAISIGLGMTPPYKKIDLFNQIQERILSLYKERKIATIIIFDEAQYLNTKILNDLKIIVSFNMDSENYATIILSGQPIIANTLSMSIHEALAQRIVINYSFNGFSKDEMEEYIDSRLKICGVHENMFDKNALEAMWSCCGGSPRVINSLAEKCLLIGFQKSAKVINSEIVMFAKNEISLI